MGAGCSLHTSLRGGRAHCDLTHPAHMDDTFGDDRCSGGGPFFHPEGVALRGAAPPLTGEVTAVSLLL